MTFNSETARSAGRKSSRKTIQKIVREFLSEKNPKTHQTRLNALLEKLMEEGMIGNVHAIKELLDRGYGKATQPMSGDEDGAPVQIVIKGLDKEIK